MLAPYDIALASDDESRRLDHGQVMQRVVRLGMPHCRDLVPESVEFFFLCGRGDVGSRECVGSLTVDESVRIEIRSDSDETTDECRMVHRKVEPDDSAVAKADNVDWLQSEGFEKLERIVSHQSVGKGSGAVARSAMASAVDGNHRSSLGKGANLIVHVDDRAQPAMQDNDGG